MTTLTWHKKRCLADYQQSTVSDMRRTYVSRALVSATWSAVFPRNSTCHHGNHLWRVQRNFCSRCPIKIIFWLHFCNSRFPHRVPEDSLRSFVDSQHAAREDIQGRMQRAGVCPHGRQGQQRTHKVNIIAFPITLKTVFSPVLLF